MKKGKLVFSDQLIGYFDNFSQSAAVDMGRSGGGHVKSYVAEQCIIAVEIQGRDVAAELNNLLAKYSYRAVLKEASKHVRVL